MDALKDEDAGSLITIRTESPWQYLLSVNTYCTSETATHIIWRMTVFYVAVRMFLLIFR